MNHETLAVDFAALAIHDQDFAKIYTANEGNINFQDPETVQQLTKSILKKEFNLIIELPNNRLCPPVPVRYSYIKWIQQLLDSTSDEFSDEFDAKRNVVGIDIGVGASCIYPLLGCKARPRWRFGGTEIDQSSFESAQRNIAKNNLQNRIRLHKVTESSPLLPLSQLGIEKADFVMCNPPFFISKQDMMATHLSKKRSPSAICSGAEIEMITKGGDLGFVERIIGESEKIQDEIQWFSSLLGKLSSVGEVVSSLKKKNISNWAVAGFQAGNVTKRWVVAWSFHDLRPRNDVARGYSLSKDILPFPTEFEFQWAAFNEQLAASKLNALLVLPNSQWSWDTEHHSGLFLSQENVWSRAARRKRERNPSNDKLLESQDSDQEDSGFVARIACDLNSHQIKVRWLKGRDTVLFESFCGMIKRALTNDGAT